MSLQSLTNKLFQELKDLDKTKKKTTTKKLIKRLLFSKSNLMTKKSRWWLKRKRLKKEYIWDKYQWWNQSFIKDGDWKEWWITKYSHILTPHTVFH